MSLRACSSIEETIKRKMCSASYRTFVSKATSRIWRAGDKFDETGAFVSVRFGPSADGYIIGTFKTTTLNALSEKDDVKSVEDDERRIVCKGVVPGFLLGLQYDIIGTVVDDKKWGIQVNIKHVAPHIMTEAESIEGFLGSGAIHGIGKKTAADIVAMFGTDSLNIIRDDPDQLLKINGIGEKKLETIKNGLPNNFKYVDQLGFLSKIGVSYATANKIVDVYGSMTETVLKKNPYILCNLHGYAFTRADAIAKKLGIEHNDPNRIKAGLYATVRWLQDARGHTVVPIDMLLNEASEKIQIDNRSLLTSCLKSIADDKNIDMVIDDEGAHMLTMYRSENAIKSYLKKSMASDVLLTSDKCSALISEFSHTIGAEITDEQKLAVVKAFQRKLSIITGGAGTGKTLTCRMIVGVARIAGYQVCLISPTGRAAQHLSDVCGLQGYTIHRALGIGIKRKPEDDIDYYKDDDIVVSRKKKTPSEIFFDKSKIIIADEASMLDTNVAAALFRKCRGKHLILVGDPNQLPSVGPGSVLSDLVESSYSKFNGMTTRLTKIFRQAEESPVITAANRVLNGKSPIGVEGVTFINAERNEDVPRIIDRYVLPKIRRENLGYDEYCFLSPMKKTPYAGVTDLNRFLRPKLNKHYKKPESESKEAVLQRGDFVMQVKNDYNLDVFNGDIGVVKDVGSDGVVTVMFSSKRKPVVYSRDCARKELQQAYCRTVHKSQGDEYHTVIVVMTDSQFIMLNRNLLYTAITRASEELILIGTPKAFSMAASNKKENVRYTGLKGI